MNVTGNDGLSRPVIGRLALWALALWTLAMATPEAIGSGRDSAVFQEKDFRRQPALAAKHGDLVLLRLERARSGARYRTNRARFRLEAGTYRFCLENDKAMRRLILRNRRGKAVLRLRGTLRTQAVPAGSRPAASCKAVRVRSPERHTLIVTHDSRRIAANPRIAFVKPQSSPSPSLLTAAGTPLGGYWALRPDPSMDPSGRRGRVTFAPLTWRPTVPMGAARDFASLTSLASGQVLAAGGDDANQNGLASAEVYDPATGSWRPTGALAMPSDGQAATLLPSGKVLLTAGMQGALQPSVAELYDPGAGTWRPTAAMPADRQLAPAALLPSGQVLVPGGFSTTTEANVAELYDPASDTWSITAPMNQMRALFGHTATTLPSGNVLVAGSALEPSAFNTAEIYDPHTAQWTLTAPMNDGRGGHSASLLPSGEVLVAGGVGNGGNPDLTSAELYDETTGTWSRTGSLNQARNGHAAVLLPWGGVWVAGGVGQGGGLSSTELWDPGTGEWAFQDDLVIPRDVPGAVLLVTGPDAGSVLVAGGNSTSTLTELSNPFVRVGADFTAPQLAAPALVNFSNPQRPTSLFVGGPLDLMALDPEGFSLIWRQDPSAVSGFFGGTAPISVTDLGQYRAQLGVKRPDGSMASLFALGGQPGPMPLHLDYLSTLSPPPTPATFQVLYRYYPDGTQIGTLQEGEVAIFQECGFKGKAAVFALSAPDLGEISGLGASLDNTAASIRISNNTGVVLYTESQYGGASQAVTMDTDCSNGTPIGAGTVSSLQVQALLPTVAVSTGNCKDCVIQGVNIGKVDLTKVDLTGAFLDGTSLCGSTLQSTTLTGASLQCLGELCADLSNTVLAGANLDHANLSGATLYAADLSGQPSSNLSAASVQQAHLKNANLSKAKLSGANFSSSNLYGDNASNGSSPGCGMNSSSGGSSNCGIFTNSCASAFQATLTDATFSDAYLYGLDLRGAGLQGTNFSRAVLTGANFGGAAITLSASSTVASFNGAYLQGTNLDQAGDGSGNAPVADLTNAFLDFRANGNELFINLSGPIHNSFACPSGPPCGTPTAPPPDVCVDVIYSLSSTVPGSDPNIGCPNDTKPAQGCGPPFDLVTGNPNTHWKSPLDITQPANPGPPPGWYANTPSFGAASPDNVICNGQGSNAAILDW